MHCSICKVAGHKRNTCPLKVAEPIAATDNGRESEQVMTTEDAKKKQVAERGRPKLAVRKTVVNKPPTEPVIRSQEGDTWEPTHQQVKFGETLRRFNASLIGGSLDLDMNGLTEMIISLFSLPSDSDLTLTYIDEDGDVVTMADDADLDDVVRQSLNPLRISVKLNGERCVKSHGISSGKSTPMRSPRAQLPLHNLDGSVSKVFKSVPETVLEKLSTLLTELGSTTTSQPGYAEFLETLSKIGLTYLKEVTATKCEPSVNTTETPMTKDDNDLSKKAEVTKGASDSWVDVVDLDVATNGNNLRAGSTSVDPSTRSLSVAVFPSKETKSSSDSKWEGVENSYEKSYSGRKPISSFNGVSGAKDVHSGNSFGSHVGVNSFGECPFSGMANDTISSYVSRCPYAPPVVPSRKSENQNADIGSILHRGVQCDGCGIHPITGPRFKSKVKEDYDLCSVCFGDMGNNSDYIRMDRPISFQHPFSLKGFYNPPGRGGRCTPTHPQVSRGSPTKSKLDSSFVADVSINDGTVIAPSTPFTKIWRLKNNGNVVWPRGSQLVWIGGDRFSKILSAELEIPAEGCPLDSEIDITVDFKSPELPGGYISYWRMSAPSGQKFGQRIWVLIQVHAPLSKIAHGFNLNLPYCGTPESHMENVSKDPQMENGSVEPIVDSLPKIDNPGRSRELVEPMVDSPSHADQELNFPINDTLLVGVTESSPTPVVASSNLSEVATPIATSPAKTSNTDGNSKDEAEQTLLKEQALLWELEEMGFTQVHLNKETLRMNEYDLEQSVDALCGVSEWDHLEELQDMVNKEHAN